jgi:hypothetical protein
MGRIAGSFSRDTSTTRRSYFCGDSVTGRRDYCHPSLYPPIGNLLYRNNGDGTFTDVTASSGVGAALGKGLGVVVSDFDSDGRPDIYVANDTTMNFFFHNLGAMKFEDVSLYPKLSEELLRRGHSEAQVKKVLGENFLAFFARVEAVKAKLSSEPPATAVYTAK